MSATIDSRPATMTAGANLTGKIFRFGKHSAAGIVACSVAGERADGIIGGGFPRPTAVAAGDALDLYIDRIPIVESGAAYSAAVNLTTDALGRAVAAGAGDFVNAVSIDPSTAAGQLLRIRPVFGPATAQEVANAAVAPTEIRLSGDGLYVIDIPDAATTTYVFENAEKIEIIDAWNIKDGAGAANTIQVTNSADVAITNAMAAAVDATVTRVGTLAKATRTLAAGAGFKVVATRAAGTMAAQLFIRAIKRA